MPVFVEEAREHAPIKRELELDFQRAVLRLALVLLQESQEAMHALALGVENQPKTREQIHGYSVLIYTEANSVTGVALV